MKKPMKISISKAQSNTQTTGTTYLVQLKHEIICNRKAIGLETYHGYFIAKRNEKDKQVLSHCICVIWIHSFLAMKYSEVMAVTMRTCNAKFLSWWFQRPWKKYWSIFQVRCKYPNTLKLSPIRKRSFANIHHDKNQLLASRLRSASENHTGGNSEMLEAVWH